MPGAVPTRARRRPGSGGWSFAYPVPEAGQLALDPPVAPARVLPCQLHHQDTNLIGDWRASGSIRVGPFLPDQAPAPDEQGGRCHDPVRADKFIRAGQTPYLRS